MWKHLEEGGGAAMNWKDRLRRAGKRWRSTKVSRFGMLECGEAVL